MANQNDEQEAANGKGKAFFDRGDQVAETGNWDFAIEMYLEGIRREPGNLQRGHQPLREVSLKRKAQGGKSAGLMEGMKHKGGKEPVDALVNAEYLLAKDPGKVAHMAAVLKAAQRLEEVGLVKWIADIIFEVMRRAKRPNKRVLALITEAYSLIQEYTSAVQACDRALQISPNDGSLQEMAKDLSARATIQQGQYDGEGTFVKSVRDLGRQMELAQRDHLAQSRQFLEGDVEKTRAEYEESPQEPGRIGAYVDALTKFEEEGYENEAMDVLKKAHADTGTYRFKMRLDDVKVRQMRRRFNKLKSSGQGELAMKLARELLAYELKMYAERAENYPTDLSMKFELGRRQLTAGQIDGAIGSLQQARRDPKRRIQALTYLGQAFGKKEWHHEAVETYEGALELEPSEERAKELHYSLALELKAMDERGKALEHFSQVAQMDYTYRDVREQIEALRKEIG